MPVLDHVEEAMPMNNLYPRNHLGIVNEANL